MMTLSNKTLHNLSKALQDEVIDYIVKDERYAEFMMEMIPNAIQSKLGKVDEDVLSDLSMFIMERLDLRPSGLPFS